MDGFDGLLDGPRERLMRKAGEVGLPFADLERITPDPAALIAIPQRIAKKYGVLPLKREGGNIWVAVGEQPFTKVEKLANEIGLMVFKVMSLQEATDELIRSGVWWVPAE